MKRKLLAVIVLVGAAVPAYTHSEPPPPSPPPPAPTLTVSPATVPAGGASTTILVEWSGIPNPLPGDWLGIYPAGVAPHGFAVGNPMWLYVDCQQHVGAGVRAVPAGVCTFEVPGLAPGQYQASLLANEGMTELARAVFTVGAGPPPLTLTVFPATVPAGGSSTTILVEWSGIPNPTAGDWLGIYPAAVAPHGFAVGNPRWKYVDCQQHVGAGVQPVPAGVCTFEVSGLAAGHYRTSLLANEGITELARAEFAVETGAPPAPPPPPLPPPPPPGSTSVLSPWDFAYLGAVRAPSHVLGVGALAGKNENGQIVLYMLSPHSELYSMRYKGNASIASPPTLTATFEGWPTWNDNTRLDTSWDYATGAERRPNGNQWPHLGLAYHDGLLYVTYLDYYNSDYGATDHCLVVADLTRSGGSRSTGPYRFAGTSVKPICGGLTVTPEGLGMGGSMMALSRNYDNTWGPSLSILPWHAIGTNAGGFGSPQLSVTERLMHSQWARASRASDYRPNLSDPYNPDGPMPPPGTWTQRDRMNTIVWIETASGKRGFLTMGGMGTGQIWYGSWEAGPNGEINYCQSADRGENAEGFRPEWRIYDQHKLNGGVVQPDSVFSPWDLSPEPNFGACERYYSGAYFDRATGLLFAASLGEIQVWQVR